MNVAPLGRPWALLLLLVVVGGVTSPSMSAGFLYDDLGVIVRGDVIHDWANFPEMLGRPAMYVNALGDELSEDHTYRPVPLATFFVDASLYGRQAWGYHLTSWLLHLACVALVYLLALRLLPPSSSGYALLAAALFGTQPHLAEAYVWINGRSDPLAALLGVSSLLVWRLGLPDEARGARRTAAWTGAAALFFLALLSKEIWLVGLPVLALTPWLASRSLRERFVALVPFAAATLACVIVRHLVLRAALRGSTGSRVWDALPRLPLFLLESAGEFVAPVHLYLRHLHAEYAARPPWLSMAAIALLAALAFAAFRARQRAPVALWGAAWFAALLAPAVLVVNSPGWLGFGRYLYVPGVGLAIVLASGFAALARLLASRERATWIAPALALVLVLRQTVLLAFEMPDYQSERALYADVVEQAPDMAHGLLGVARTMLTREQAPAAVELLRRAAELDSTNIEAGLELIQALKLSSDLRGAERVARSMMARVPPQRINAVRVELVSTLHLHAVEESAQLMLDCLAQPYQQNFCYPWIRDFTHGHPHSARYRELFAQGAARLPAEARATLERLSR
jgi:hypothetical protein